MQKFLEKRYKIIIFAMLAFVAVVSILNAKNDSAIYDEIAHIPAGYSYLTEQDMRLNPEHPPLIKNLSALPLLFMDLNFDTTKDFWTKDNVADSQWNAGKYLLYGAGNDADKIIFWSRIPIILLSLIFGLFIFKWTRELAGTIAGLFALTLYSFDPNILGHNHFVTTDLGIAAFITFDLYYFLKFIRFPSWKNVILSGLFLGLLQLAKFSSVLVFPIMGLAIIIYPIVRKDAINRISTIGTKFKNLGEYLGKGFVIFAISIIVVWIVYFFNTFSMPAEKITEATNHYFTYNYSNPMAEFAKSSVEALNGNVITRPLAEYVFGMFRVFQRVGGGNNTYFMGEISSKGFLSYFPVVYLIKEPLSILVFAFFSLFYFFAKFGKAFYKLANHYIKDVTPHLAKYIRNHITEICLFSFILVYSLTSITGRLNIGLRHLFPIFPFIYILSAKSIFGFIRKLKNKQSEHLSYIFLAALTFLLVAETVLVYPNYMSYFNQSVGGPKNGYRFVTDSNADWGQDMKRLKLFLDNHPEIEKIRVDYFGMSDAKYYLKDTHEGWWSSRRPLESGWYAISVGFLQESIHDKTKKSDENYSWLQNKKPTYQVGTSILVYYITQEELQ